VQSAPSGVGGVSGPGAPARTSTACSTTATRSSFRDPPPRFPGPLNRPGHSSVPTRSFTMPSAGCCCPADHLLKHILVEPASSRGPPRRQRRFVRRRASSATLDSLPPHARAGPRPRAARPRRSDRGPQVAHRPAHHPSRAPCRQSSTAWWPSKPRTAYELAQSLWGNIAVTQAYLTLSEVLGHMDILVGRRPGAPRGSRRGGVARFEAS